MRRWWRSIFENKEGTAAHFKGGFGFHPMFCFADATGETLAAELRPGERHRQQPHRLVSGARRFSFAAARTGGRWSPLQRRPELVSQPVVVRSDSAGASRAFVDALRDRNVGFAVVARRQTTVSAAVQTANTDPGRWRPALNQDGTKDNPTGGGEAAAVCEVTDLVDLSTWPDATRLIIRRQPLHPGAQTTLLPDLEYRFWGHYTDQEDDPAELDRFIRAHAHVEDHIGRLKDSGLERFPFTDLVANQAWLQLVCRSADPVR